MAFDTQYQPCPTHLRREALLHLVAVHDPELAGGLQRALAAQGAMPTADWQGLWVAMEGEHIVASAWVQPLANQTAQLWLPRDCTTAAERLLRAVHAWVARQPIVLCHVTLSEPWAAWEDTLVKSGMRAMATLEHRTWPCRSLPAPTPTLALRPFDARTPAGQLSLLARVGEGSLDCPALREALPDETLLAGLQAQLASAHPSHWYEVVYREATLGILLLAPSTPCWSLQLMGLAREWRGQGLGLPLLRHAQHIAAKGGAERLTLTVDTQNVPAQRVYASAGFVVQGRERLLGWY